MEFTNGEIIFYSGISGMIIVALIGVVAIIKFSKSRKRIFNELNKKYGIVLK